MCLEIEHDSDTKYTTNVKIKIITRGKENKLRKNGHSFKPNFPSSTFTLLSDSFTKEKI